MTEKLFRECGAGWYPLVDIVEAMAKSCGVEILQIKEKFGKLDINYVLPDTDEDINALNDFVDAVDQAHVDSARMCEMCGKRSRMMSSGRWLKTLCKDHALELGYKDMQK